jgi:hypothetical protein
VRIASCLTILLLCACGQKPSRRAPTVTDAGLTMDAGEARPDAGVDAGFAASHAALPEVVTQSGAILVAPQLVPVFFTNDDATTPPKVLQFLNKLVAAQYWDATLHEYGVGHGTVEPAVNAGVATAIDDADLGDWLAAKIDAHVLPTPNANTLYLLHYPKDVAVTEGGGTACQDWDAYHSEFEYGAAAQNVAYAVIPRCPAGTSGLDTEMDVLTTSESHEIVEAATDPYPDYDPAFTQADDAHLFWDDVNSGSEIADMCQYDKQAYANFADLGFLVQRSWSNEAAQANGDPCVPALPGEVFFNAVPVLSESLSYSYGGQHVHVPGITIPVGQSKTVTLDLYSDRETAPWTILAQDYGAWSCTMGAVDPQCATTMTFAYSATKGRNGDHIQLTITPTARGSTGANGRNDYFIVTSTNAAGEQHFSVGYVAE